MMELMISFLLSVNVLGANDFQDGVCIRTDQEILQMINQVEEDQNLLAGSGAIITTWPVANDNMLAYGSGAIITTWPVA